MNLALFLAVARDLKTGFVKRFLTLCLVASTITFAQGLGVSTPNYLTFTNYGSDVVVMGRIFNDRSPVLSSHPILAPDAQIWPAPRRLSPMIPQAPSYEGEWSPVGQRGLGGAVVFDTVVTPYPGATTVSVAWIDQTNASLSIYAGTTQPQGSFPYQGYVAPSLQSQLVAAFEGGFQFQVANGGFYEAGTTAIPLRYGAASLVQYDNGTLNIGSWGPEVQMNSQVYAVRQNLTLLIDNGSISPETQVNPLVTWGYSLGNLLATWRSGVGITAGGNLIWVGGPGLSPYMLAKVLQWAGAVRAMQLDINPDWVNFATYTYQQGIGAVGSNLSPAMYFPASHYLSPFWRDFVAVFLRN
ncbi:hypothetical protein SAMN02745225_02190 [Ferrithrix thermotolerans DSM 19514]|uniref:Phosphodiester glycosidase domain-containing protein n=1 Tax=Ferrithrix thermotolerans DSM 19514 TaxID=1121881 RepID=A0A1M4Y039_9ACTN|nr:hypothetical protein [Ferrithrix thermotolerans]SHE99039.1 hypothetical protein SAMN02745225_02190 [Ferrithrix thermotolerans DSM 19514]